MVEQPIPLQRDLFSGELVDTRTPTQKKAERERQQPQQIEMFSQHEVAQFGVSARPVMPFSPGKLVLIQEDLRTDEEIERDLMRQAQAMTPNLFAGNDPATQRVVPAPEIPRITQPPPAASVELSVAISLPDDEAETSLPSDPPLTKLAAYLILVNAAQEQAATLSTTPVSALSESISMNLAKLDARHTGLTGDEIAAALTIGAYLGRKTLPYFQTARQPSQVTTPSKEIPILWTTKTDMVKRRPDLALQLEKLRDDEVEALAVLVGNALEEFYWMQLNVVLSLYLDHELRLYRQMKQQP